MARRLNSIELLPREVDEDIAYVKKAIIEERKTQKTILNEFNTRLITKGLERISSAAFNRWVISLREKSLVVILIRLINLRSYKVKNINLPIVRVGKTDC